MATKCSSEDTSLGQASYGSDNIVFGDDKAYSSEVNGDYQWWYIDMIVEYYILHITIIRKLEGW